MNSLESSSVRLKALVQSGVFVQTRLEIIECVIFKK